MKMLEVPLSYGFFATQCFAGVSAWLKKTVATVDMPAADMLVRIHCKTCTTSVRLVFSTRAKCEEFVATYRDDGLLYAVDGPWCDTRATFIVRQSKSPEDREIGRRFKPLWEVLAPKLEEIFTDKDAIGNFGVPALEGRAQVLSTYDRRIGARNPSLLLPHSDRNRISISLLLVCVSLVLLMMCCSRCAWARSYMMSSWCFQNAFVFLHMVVENDAAHFL